MSSGRESVGDLVPQDVLEVLALDRQGRKGKRSRRRGIGRAFTWLKGRRRKTLKSGKEHYLDLLLPGTPVPIILPSTSTEPKVDGEGALTVQHFQENVFIEGSRPKYIQDLHSQAQEGLKLLQLDENKNGVDFQDDQSVISTVTARTDDDVSFSELVMSECESSIADTISTRSTVSYQSTRSKLTRQASTFRPLTQDKKPGKSKSKGRQRCTVLGIPRHVQKELGLDRVAWTASQFTDAQLSNGGLVISTVIPTLDSISVYSDVDGAPVHLENAENLQTVNENEPQRPLVDGNKDDLTLIQHVLPEAVDPQRPRSLAVPWMTASGSHPPSPVMYVSPQATYLSKLIPNAILPPSVDVVELSRNRSRSSVRMVSKSSLASASPAPSRASSRMSSRAPSRLSSSRASSRASSWRTAPLSVSSRWSRSGSSETLVSDSSTISSSSTPRVTSRASQEEDTDGPLRTNINGHSKNTQNSKSAWVNGEMTTAAVEKKPEFAEPFNRSLSVMKKNKVPPTPPRRSYSLHKDKHKGRSRDMTDTVLSSGFTKQDVSTTLLCKDPYSIDTRKVMPVNTSGGSRPYKVKDFWPPMNGVAHSPAVMALKARIDIPAHPIVIAPPPPPPETWAHNQRTFELLCGPGPVNLERWANKRGLKIELLAPEVLEKTKMSITAKAEKNRNEITVIERPSSTEPTKNIDHPSPSPSPSPPPEHQPPLPPINPVKPPKEDPAKAQVRPPFEEVICPPPHPHFPPPPPPVNVSHPRLSSGQDEMDFPSPPPPFSPNTLQNLPTIPPCQSPERATNLQADLQIPPPPKEVPPPPKEVLLPPKGIPPPPKEVPPPPKEVLPLPIGRPPTSIGIPPPPNEVPPPPTEIPPPPKEISSPPKGIPPAPKEIPSPPQEVSVTVQKPVLGFSIPPPPPLPMDIKQEIKTVPPDQQEKSQAPPPSIPTAQKKEEMPSPMVTQSILQMVRLRSVRSNVSQSEVPVGPPKPKQQNSSSVSHEAPQKPVRRSLIMTAPPPEIASMSTSGPNAGTPATTTAQENQGGTVPAQPTFERHMQDMPQVSAPISEITHKKSQTSTAEPKTQHPSANSGKDPAVSSEPVTQPPPTKVHHDPKIEETQTSVPEPAVLQTPSEVKHSEQKLTVQEILTPATEPLVLPTQNCSEPKVAVSVKLPAPEPPTPPSNVEPSTQTTLTKTKSTPAEQKGQNGPESQLGVTAPKLQTSTSPTQKLSTSSIPVSSMRMQEAIRKKTAAMSSTDSQAKRLSLHSPPPSTGVTALSSPSSTANFIFSKSAKKVVIEMPSSPEAQAGLKKTLVSELASVSQVAKSTDSQNKTVKVPPPVAKKPANKGETPAQSSAETENKTETEHVQTAGQEAQPDN